MAGGICLPPKVTEAFKSALTSGKINPEKLASMTTEARHAFFKDIVGEGNAKFTNAQFESKMLLKNQQQGYLTWAKKLAGVTPETRRDLITRISKLDHILNPVEEKQFLHDLASTKLGIDVTAKEAEQIANMSSKLQELAAKQKSDGTFPNETDRMAYGRAKVAMGSHLAGLKNDAEKLSAKQSILEGTKHPFQATSKVAGLSKALKATLDNSAIFRQGWKTLWTNPVIWQKNARQSFVDIVKQLGGKNTLDEVKADIVSRPNYAKYDKMKLAIGNIEEEFPSTLPDKIPDKLKVGRIYKASEGAYTGFLYRQRADIADKLLDIADKTGVDVTDKAQLEAIGKLINSLTGRGHLGRFEGTAADSLNNIFFSARFLKSNIDTLTAHTAQKGVTPFVRKQAALNLVKIVSGTAAILTIANALKPGSVDLDPRSSNFGKIKIGSTKFDVTGGMGSITTLAAQQIKNQTKSPNTGVVTDLGSGYGQQNREGLVVDFITGKFSPAAAVVRDWMKGADFDGNKPTVTSTTKNLFVPLPVSTAFNNDPHKANQLLISIADGLGIATSGKTPQRNVSQNLSKTEQAFKDKIGDTKFQQANDEYNRRYNDWLANNKDRLDNVPESEKPGIITAAKAKVQTNIYKQYNFKPPKDKSSSSSKATKKSLLDSIK